jgi:hypothetical protein
MGELPASEFLVADFAAFREIAKVRNPECSTSLSAAVAAQTQICPSQPHSAMPFACAQLAYTDWAATTVEQNTVAC